MTFEVIGDEAGLHLFSPNYVSKTGSTMNVCIDRDLYTGDGLCEEIASDVFLWHVCLIPDRMVT